MNADKFKDGESYSSCDGGNTWFQMGRGGAPSKDNVVGGYGKGCEMKVSHVDTERNIVYYTVVTSK